MNIIVVGAGGHGRVIIDALLCAGAPVIGVTDIDPDSAGLDILGVPVFGNDDVLHKHHPGSIELVNGVGSTTLPTARQAVFDRFKKQGYHFASVIHPSAIVGQSVRIGEGAQIMAGVIVQPFTAIGENAIINTRAGIDHDCQIGAHTHIAPGATLSGGITVGESSHIGCGVTVIQGINIGKNVLVAAGATVCHDVPDGTRFVGTPARERAQ